MSLQDKMSIDTTLTLRDAIYINVFSPDTMSRLVSASLEEGQAIKIGDEVFSDEKSLSEKLSVHPSAALYGQSKSYLSDMEVVEDGEFIRKVFE